MGWKKERKVPLFVRSIKNWKRYRNYTKQFQGLRDDLVHKLLQYTVDYGFNRGVELFEVEIEYDQWKARTAKEDQLKRLSKMNSVSVDQMVAKQKRMKEIEEKQKTYHWDPNWKPTFEEIKNGNFTVFSDNTIAPTMYYRIYYVPEKLAYVGLSVVPGCRPEIVVEDSLIKVMNRLEPIFNHFVSTIGDKIKKEYEDSQKVKVIKVKKVQSEPDINHVKKAMGIDDNSNKETDNKLNDLLDDIF